MPASQGGISEFEQQVISALVSALVTALGPESEVRLLTSKIAGKADAMMEVLTPAKTLRLYVDIIRDGYPRDIREAAWRLNRCLRAHSGPDEPLALVAAHSLSPGARRELQQQNIAFYDLSGSLYLQHEYWLINIEKPSGATQKNHQPFDLFTGARENVIHALLQHGHDWLSGAELAELAQTSAYTCSKVLQELTLREWSAQHGGGPAKRRKLTQPGQLLDAWAERWPVRNDRQSTWHLFVETPGNLISELSERIARQPVDFPWAFTGSAAANRITPLLTATDTAEIIVPEGCAQIMADVLKLKPASKGANVTLIERQGASLLFRSNDPERAACFASPFILYLDLLNGRGRNKELAQHLRKHLEHSWARSLNPARQQDTTSM